MSAFCNTYQQSKYEAEQVVLASGLPAAVFRLSSILGDSRTGEIRRFTYVHQLIRLLPRNVLPVAPCDPEAPLDLIPTEWARVLGYFLPHLGLYQAFERNADLGAPPPVREYYRKVVRYCLGARASLSNAARR